MANPYHDENGKFCKKEEMMGAILRLQMEGKTAAAVKLMGEYQAILREQTPPSTAAPLASNSVTLEEWQAAHGDLTAGTVKTAAFINEQLRYQRYGDEARPNLKDYLQEVLHHQRNNTTLPEKPDPEFPDVVSYHPGVLSHYSDTQPSSKLLGASGNLLVISKDGGLYGVEVQESEHTSNWQVHPTAWALEPPTEMKVEEHHWEVQHSPAANEEARKAYERTFPPGTGVSELAQGFPYAEEETKAKYDKLRVDEFYGQHLFGLNVRQSVFNIDGNYYIAEEHVSSWDDGRGTLVEHFRKAEPITRTRTILHFVRKGTPWGNHY